MRRQLKRTRMRRKVAGYKKGFQDGVRDGACTAAFAAIPQPALPPRPLRVLYVPQGFPAIDHGVSEALRMSVGELHIAESSRMLELAASIKPDLVLVLNGLHFFPPNHLQQIDAIRGLGTRTAIWFADDPYFTEQTVEIAPHYDTVLTHELAAVDLYRGIGCSNVHYLPLGADPSLFRPMAVEPQYRSDVCFIGQGFWNRIELFDAVASKLSKHRVVIAGGLWDRLKRHRLLKSNIKDGWMPIEESVKYYNGAKIVINIHRTTEALSDNKNTYRLQGKSINPRTYEISACGTLQLTDIREDLPSYYRPGLELETFTGPRELMGKIEYYLKREDERRRIALQGLIRTMRDHSYAARIQRLLMLLGY
ncbi:CgeB family protein [Paenibacillus beijingensis]|uniref:Spore maturation protein n=1 Tax=Paenibacillus beijingensis TaxID=1126833 RepID=A0A0D5NDX1_9BACL|nr:glycosyltransferase [Paenibacillus beijingensis]AJY73599.1 spore maturation protein [Paenibacillus beijingensis]